MIYLQAFAVNETGCYSSSFPLYSVAAYKENRHTTNEKKTDCPVKTMYNLCLKYISVHPVYGGTHEGISEEKKH